MRLVVSHFLWGINFQRYFIQRRQELLNKHLCFSENIFATLLCSYSVKEFTFFVLALSLVGCMELGKRSFSFEGSDWNLAQEKERLVGFWDNEKTSFSLTSLKISSCTPRGGFCSFSQFQSKFRMKREFCQIEGKGWNWLRSLSYLWSVCGHSGAWDLSTC